MNTSVDIQDWLEAQSKDSALNLSQLDLKLIETALSSSISNVLGRDDQGHDEKMEIVEMYRVVRLKISACIVR
jgi:hypothetical protein